MRFCVLLERNSNCCRQFSSLSWYLDAARDKVGDDLSEGSKAAESSQ